MSSHLYYIGPAVRFYINICMRYQIFHDDIGNLIILDTLQDLIVFKVRNTKIASTVCQKLNKRYVKDSLVNRRH
jgi:hypothetical protein